MGGVLGSYSVMQQNEWAGRMFYSAQDRRTGQVVYLISEPAVDPARPYEHATLPHVQPLTVEGDVRWLVGTVPDGESLEDLRSEGRLTEQEIVSALLSVVDALGGLAELNPPLVPGYLDPACIKRDRLGRWTLDYLALAHAPEARKSSGTPPGVYPFGVLLYWLITGQTARLTRVQVTRIQQGVSAALQFVVIRCLGRSYDSLADLRADLERAGNEREFKALAQSLAQQSQQRPRAPERQAPISVPDIPVVPTDPPALPKPALSLEYRRVPLGGPAIPVNDRPWALPPRPDEGFRKYVVPPPPDPVMQRFVRWIIIGTFGLATAVAAAGLALKFDVVPEPFLPAFLRPARFVSAFPGMTEATGEMGRTLPPDPVRPGDGPWSDTGFEAQHGMTLREWQELMASKGRSGRPSDVAMGGRQPPQPSSGKQPVVQPPKQPGKSTPPVVATTPDKPVRPVMQVPQPGSAEHLDARVGGLPILVFVDGRPTDYAYMFPHPRSPYVSLEAFNSLMGRNVYWVPNEGGGIRLLTGERSLFTLDYSLVEERLWLKLTPALQEALGVQLSAYGDGEIYFTTRR